MGPDLHPATFLDSPSKAEVPVRRFDLDPFRGLVCFSILLMHLYNGTSHATLEQWSGQTVSFLISHCRFGFESFFVIAGFFLAFSFRPTANNYLSVPNFLFRRLARLIVPYWIALGLSYLDRAIPNWFWGRQFELPNAQELVLQVLCIQNWFNTTIVNEFLWSIAVLIQVYFVYAMVFWVIRQTYLRQDDRESHYKTEEWLNVIVLMVGFASILFIYADIEDPTGLTSNGIYFALGFLAYRFSQHRGNRFLQLLLYSLTITLGIAVESSRILACTVSAAILCWLAYGHRFPPSNLTRKLTYLGKCSFSIYLLHGLIGYRILNLSNHFPSDSVEIAFLFLFLAIGVSLLGSIAFYHWVEVPWNERVRRIDYRR